MDGPYRSVVACRTPEAARTEVELVGPVLAAWVGSAMHVASAVVDHEVFDAELTVASAIAFAAPVVVWRCLRRPRAARGGTAS